MVGSNKILTVSYGTFSCTLEGFEDSFGTMKAIAEYFRDLAADDRYFGAEPPVPDVQMLALIAEREVARRVEARIDASGITLRTGEALPASMAAAMQATAAVSQPTLPAATAAADGAVVGPEAEVIGDDTSRLLAASDPTMITPSASDLPVEPLMPPVAVAPVAVAPIAPISPVRPVKVHVPLTPTIIAAPEVATRPVSIPAHPDADSVAAKLQRIRAVVGRVSVPFAAQEFAEDLAESSPGEAANQAHQPIISAPVDFTEDVAAPALSGATLQATFDAGPDLDQPFDMSSVTAALADTPPIDLPVEDVDAGRDDPVEEPFAIGAAPVAPVRARVIRMRRAEVDRVASIEAQDADSAAEGLGQADPDMGADDDFADPDALDDPDGLLDLQALDGSDALLDPEESDAAMFDSIGIDADLSDINAAPGAAEAVIEQVETGALSPDDEADLLEELAAVEREAINAPGTLAQDAAVEDAQASEEPEILVAQLVADVVVETADLSQVNAGDPVTKDDIAALFGNAPVDDEVFDFSALSAAQEETPDQPDTAQVPSDDDGTPGAVAAEPLVLRNGRSLLGREPEADEEAMERILSQTDAELNAPESSRRREAIAQLKAAVAATEAARRLGDLTGGQAEPDDEIENAFRDDLKQVVRPRRPVAEGNPEQARERPRPAPLKLVASQRIDIPVARPAPVPAMPVRPRRVAVEAEQVAVPRQTATARRDAGSFAEFAESMGAKALPDLLEAAAAYTSFVEGVEDFSRPQLMKKVRGMAPEDFSREDGLRSFGTLLRQGRIMKTRNGRFVVNEETRFNPERQTG